MNLVFFVFKINFVQQLIDIINNYPTQIEFAKKN